MHVNAGAIGHVDHGKAMLDYSVPEFALPGV